MACLITAGGVAPWAVQRAQAAPEIHEFIVNSSAVGAKDTNPGDGTCSTSVAGECSLRAAIEEGNKTTSGDVVIKVTAGTPGQTPPQFSQSFPNSTSNYMNTADDPTAADSYGAYYHITRSMTIDLDNRFHIKASGDLYTAAAFWVDAPNTNLLNFTDIFSNGSSIVFSAKSDGSVLDGGRSIQTDNYYGERMVAIRGLADGVTLRNYTAGRFYEGTYGGAVYLAGGLEGDAARSVSNLTISNFTVDNRPGSNSLCSGSGAGGCVCSGIVVAGSMAVHNLVIEDSNFTYFTASRTPIDLWALGAGSTRVDIRRNTITQMKAGLTYTNAALELPGSVQFTGPINITANRFDNGTWTEQGVAIYLDGNTSSASSQKPSNIYIEDNFFDGYQSQSIHLYEAGTTTVRRNTFGVNSGSQSTTASEATTAGTSRDATTPLLMQNYRNTSNRRIVTWAPSNPQITTNCEFRVDVAPAGSVSSGYNQPTNPVTVDFYYTQTRTAEVYLGSVSGLSGGQTVSVPNLPPVAGGHVRIQTQGTSPTSQAYESSQFSVAVAIPTANVATCWASLVLTSFESLFLAVVGRASGRVAAARL
jgi:hypothetical protein